MNKERLKKEYAKNLGYLPTSKLNNLDEEIIFENYTEMLKGIDDLIKNKIILSPQAMAKEACISPSTLWRKIKTGELFPPEIMIENEVYYWGHSVHAIRYNSDYKGERKYNEEARKKIREGYCNTRKKIDPNKPKSTRMINKKERQDLKEQRLKMDLLGRTCLDCKERKLPEHYQDDISMFCNNCVGKHFGGKL